MTSGKPPNQWAIEKFADVGTSEEFMSQFLELLDILGATLISETEKDAARNAIAMALHDGLLPAFLELKKIRKSVGQNLPIVENRQLYEDFARKSWKAHKELMKAAARALGFEIGFLFQEERKFQRGLTKFREANALAPATLEAYLSETRKLWQNDLADFRNKILEHVAEDRSKYGKFYLPEFAEALFNAVWRADIEILAMLMGLRLPKGIHLIEQSPDDPSPKWIKRFRYEIDRGPQATD